MDPKKRKRLEKAGWKVGGAQDFLALSNTEEQLVEIKTLLAQTLLNRRRDLAQTQTQVAEELGSSQSRVALMEAAHESVTIDLLVKSLVRLGVTRKQLGKVIGSD